MHPVKRNRRSVFLAAGVLCGVLFAALFFSCEKYKSALTIHYFRYNGDYECWNVWAWLPDDPNIDAKSVDFSASDADGFVTATVFFR